MSVPNTNPAAKVGKNPKRIAAGKRNRAKAGPASEATRQKLRDAIFAHKPWLRSTGPKSCEGKARTAKNALRKQNLTDTQALIFRVKEHAKLLTQLRRTAYIDPDSLALRTTDQLATDLQGHMDEVYGSLIKRLAARAITS